MFLPEFLTRKGGEVLKPLLGFRVSAQTVSKVTKGLNPEVAKLHGKILENKHKGFTSRFIFTRWDYLQERSAFEAKRRVVLTGLWDNQRRKKRNRER